MTVNPGGPISIELRPEASSNEEILHLENRIFQGDCAGLFAQIPDNSIDLILTDPPYKDYQSNRPVAREKVKKIFVNTFDLELFIRESERVLKPGCHFYCWCDHLTFPGIFEAIKKRREGISKKKAAHRFLYKNCLIWVKNNHGAGDLQGNYAPQHELVIYASKGRTRPLIGKRPSNVFFERDDQGKIRFFSKISNYRYAHGTSKPPPILERMIRSSTQRGEIVLDPYGGSMSTAEAAMRQGRRFVMCELEGDHCERGFDRLRSVREELLVEGYEPSLLAGPYFDPPLEEAPSEKEIAAVESGSNKKSSTQKASKKSPQKEVETLSLDLPDLLKA